MTSEAQQAGFTVEHLGCKVSHTDAETVRDSLRAAGHVEQAAGASIGVVNACCITAEAEKKTRKRVRRLLDEAGGDGRVFVTGCGAALHADQYTDIDERVRVVPGAAGLAAAVIVEAADELAGLGCRGPVAGVAPGHDPSTGYSTPARSRAFVKVQDGCDFSCSYCIVPTVRGAPRSRTTESIIREVDRRAQQGIVEIVLTGVNIGLYRDPDTRASLPKLLPLLAARPGIRRIRISSIEVNHVSRRLVEAMVDLGDVVCPHLHVPMQSGDDAVLKAMHRHYDSGRYRRAIDAARKVLPSLNLTTDVIVGYPTEDEAAFARTLELVRDLGITKVHAFPFSERPGTEAVAASDPVPRHVKAERSARLRAVGDAGALAHRARLVGSFDEVVLETRRVAGYGASAGVLLTDGHDVAHGSRNAVGDGANGTAAAAPVRTGYTRDYSPVLLDQASLHDDLSDGSVVSVAIECLDETTGMLHARVLGPAAG